MKRLEVISLIGFLLVIGVPIGIKAYSDKSTSTFEQREAEKITALLKETSERVALEAEKESTAAQTKLMESLDDEEEQIQRQNRAAQHNIELMEAKRQAQLMIADAERERQKAEIDAKR